MSPAPAGVTWSKSCDTTVKSVYCWRQQTVVKICRLWSKYADRAIQFLEINMYDNKFMLNLLNINPRTTAVCTSMGCESTRNIFCFTEGALVTWPWRSPSLTSRSSSMSPSSTSPTVREFFPFVSNFAAFPRLPSECLDFDELGLMGNFSLDMLDRWTSYLQLAISSSSSFSLECRERRPDPDCRLVRSTAKTSTISSPLPLAVTDDPDPNPPRLPLDPDPRPEGVNLLGVGSEYRPRSWTGSGTVVG